MEARKILSQVAVSRMKDSIAKAVRYLGVTTSAMNRMASHEEAPEIERVLKTIYR